MFSRKIDEIYPVDLAESMEDGPEQEDYLVIDVREAAEYVGDMGHIKGSRHIPLMELKDFLDEFRENNRKLVFVCSSGERSYYACSFLKDQGIEDVVNLKGGMIQWHLSGLDVEYEE